MSTISKLLKDASSRGGIAPRRKPGVENEGNVVAFADRASCIYAYEYMDN